MTLGNTRSLGVQNLIASCLDDACRHSELIDVSSYPAETEVPWFAGKVECAKCGARGRHIDVRPNWKEQPVQPTRRVALNAKPPMKAGYVLTVLKPPAPPADRPVRRITAIFCAMA
jgi:hypothetical protein